MKNNLFLLLCQQAENNQSYSLANYLTWRSHQRDTGYIAKLWDDDLGLQLVVCDVETKACYVFDLSIIGDQMQEEQEWLEQEQAENASQWLNELHTIDEATNILCMDKDMLWEMFGDASDEIIEQAYIIVEPAIEATWDDFDPDYPNNCVSDGVIVNGVQYRTNYSGVAGNFWNSEWEYWG